MSYVYAGYGITVVALVGYAGWLLSRARASSKRAR